MPGCKGHLLLGRARTTLPTAEDRQRRSKMALPPSSARRARPAWGLHLGGPGAQPRVWQASSLLPSGFSTGPNCFSDSASMLQQNSRGHSLWAGAPAWRWASWSLNTGTGLSLLPVCFPDHRWGGKSNNSNSSNNSYPLVLCARPCA